MKDAWNEENDDIELSIETISSSHRSHKPSLLNGISSPPDRATILASLPSKEAADKLIHRFFSYYNPAAPAKCKSNGIFLCFNVSRYFRKSRLDN